MEKTSTPTPYVEKREKLPFWKSKIIWANTIAIIAIIVQQYTGWIIDESIQAQLLAVINILLRTVTSKAIGIK